MIRISIPNVVFKTALNKPLTTAKRGDDGDIVWETEPWVTENGTQVRGTPVKEDSVTATVIRDVILALSNIDELHKVHKPMDGHRVHRLWNQVESSLERHPDMISLKTAEYDWLHQALDRTVPKHKTKEGDEVLEQTVAHFMWKLNDWRVVEQLKTLSERKPLREDDEEEVEKEKPVIPPQAEAERSPDGAREEVVPPKKTAKAGRD